jgi:rubrerythrin
MIMSKLNSQIKLSFRVELFGTGFYRGLSSQYRKKYPDLAKKLDDYAAHEYEHSILFNKCYSDLFGKKLGGEGFWLGFGKCQSYLLFALPVSIKLKMAAQTEVLAIKMLEKDIATGQQNQYIEVAKKILPDEKKHAGIYKEWKKA